MENPPAPGGITILYDGECPLCRSYVRMTRLRASAGPVRLLDLRQGGAEVDEAARAGHDFDAGFVVKFGGALYHGDAAMLVLSGLTTPSGLFNRLMRVLFRNPRRARLVYPVLVRGRNLLLRLLGRRKFADAKA